ncbi:MAG: glucose-1-phosphate thymidylyltransferase [bacterium]|nr:glucose-1-phosphate thymidylyltransferase [bacterium]
MKALIAAGGHGTRLRPLTYTLNKHLIPIANKPMIFYALEKIAETGIKEVGITLNPGDTIFPKAVGDGKRWGVKITYIEQTGGPLGLAHVIRMAEPFLKKDPFVYYLGDNIILSSITGFIKKFEKEKLNCLLALSKVKDPERFGVPEIKDGKILKVEEKPQNPKSDFAVTGIYLYDHNIFDVVKKLKPSVRGELEISDAHTLLIEKGLKVGYSEITGWWKDTGKPYDLLDGNQLILSKMETRISPKAKIEKGVTLQGNIVIGDDSEIRGKTLIRGPVIIGNSTIIQDAYIGPYTSIGNRVEIYSAEIDHSIIFDDVDINTDKRITDSLIGKNAMITPVRETLPGGHKLIIGDNSHVEL